MQNYHDDDNNEINTRNNNNIDLIDKINNITYEMHNTEKETFTFINIKYFYLIFFYLKIIIFFFILFL